MMYDRNDYLPKAEYAKACKVPKGAVKLRGASYTKSTVFGEESLFNGFGIKQGMATSLFSYGRGICDYCADVLIMDVNAFSYSNTTCRHISEFLKLYTHLEYTDLKREYDYADPIAGQFIKVGDTTILFV